MTREIKFRAWDKIGKHMYPIMETRSNSRTGILMVTTFSGENLKIPEECELMQYTGLKDKNGKEIYEGDIVKSLIKSRTFPEGKIAHCTINWSEDETSDDSWGTTIVGFRSPMGEDWEIIGNIYENSDLLK